MLQKFIPTTVKPTVEDVIQGWEGEGSQVPAVVEEVVLNYIYMRDLYDEEENQFDLTAPLEMALREEGPCFIINGDYEAAEKFCEMLHKELQFDLECLVDSYMEDGALRVKVADDVLAYVQAEAKRRLEDLKEEIEMTNEQINAMMKSVGLEVGMELHLHGASVVITGFRATDEGAKVILNAGGKEVEVAVSDVLEVKANQKSKEENNMKPSIKLGANQNIQKEEVQMNKEMIQEEVVAQSEAAQAFLAATEKSNKEEETMKQQPSIKLPSQEGGKRMATVKLTKKEEVKGEMNNPNTAIINPEVALKGIKGSRPTVALGTATRPVVKGNPGAGAPVIGVPTTSGGLKSKEKGVFASAETSKAFQGRKFVATPWYMVNRFEYVVQDESIMEVGGRNEALGIDGMAIFDTKELYDAGILKFYDDKNVAIVELYLAGGNIVIPFKIALNDSEHNPSPVTSSNIAVRNVGGVYKAEYVMYTKNETKYRIKCAKCGAWNDIKKVGEGQHCTGTKKTKCDNIVGVKDAEAVGGEFVNSNYVQQSLPYGFQFNEEILAQVMVFAHYALEEDFIHPNYIG